MRTLGIVTPHPPIMVPDVGGPDAAVTSASARALTLAGELIERFAPDAIVLMSPHAPAMLETFTVDAAPRVAGSLAMFGAPRAAIDAAGDPELAVAIVDAAREAGIDAEPVTRPLGSLDHGALVPLSFLDPDGRWPVVELTFTDLPLAVHRAFGAAVAAGAEAIGRRVVFVASGDTSHRLFRGAPAGFSPRARDFDRWLIERIGSGDWAGLVDADLDLWRDAGECGLRSFVTLGGFLEGSDAVTRVLTYEGPWGVGYLTAVATDPAQAASLPETPFISEAVADRGERGGAAGADASPHARLARAAVTAWVRDHRRFDALADYPELLDTRAGAFVSLHRGGELRGCIGTIAPTRPTLAEEIVDRAIEASTRDPRFAPMRPDELADLDISVDVLHPAEPVGTFADPAAAEASGTLDPASYGVIVTNGHRRGLLLPDLEGVDTATDQVAIALRKAGIAIGEPFELERFRVDRHR
jgi:AmmeMemoRadiSam system protein A